MWLQNRMHHTVSCLLISVPLNIMPSTAAPYEIITRDGKVFDIDKDDTDRW